MAHRTYLPIHGAWHGAWCWYKLMSRLERLGHTVIAPDLPSLGRDRTPVDRVSLPLWREFVCNILDTQTEPVILVGHSRGGIVISEAAEQRPRTRLSQCVPGTNRRESSRSRAPTAAPLNRAAEYGDIAGQDFRHHAGPLYPGNVLRRMLR